MRLRTHRALVLPAVGSLLLLGACSAGETLEPDDEATPSAEATEEAPEADEDGDGGTTEASGGAACLEGDWSVDLDSLLEATLSAPGLEALEPEIEVTGDSTVTFADGTFTAAYDDQVTSMSWAMEGQEFSTVSGFDGELTGTYEATDAEVTLSDLDASGVTLTNTTSINGEEVDLGTDQAVTDAFSMGGTSTYECTDDELRLTPVVEGAETSGFVTVLHRR
ncbi:hypothetical protein GXB85_14530 [Cellulomonas sp. APG4]|uniref:hypothetical protein n=1 Tax=Cellulomonas sp. APG4 TaxID=1538656 RepID=UPI00137A99F5|nr:hypothetical protein [Cellulomonas sp. APG4]NCT92159.1 hypothetical protein [Cellulomonas sp. APG4]